MARDLGASHVVLAADIASASTLVRSSSTLLQLVDRFLFLEGSAEIVRGGAGIEVWKENKIERAVAELVGDGFADTGVATS